MRFLRLFLTLIALCSVFSWLFATPLDSSNGFEVVSLCHRNITFGHGLQINWVGASEECLPTDLPLMEGENMHRLLEDLYPGIDLEVMAREDGTTHFTFHFGAEADFSQVKLAVSGAVWVPWSRSWQLSSGAGAFVWEGDEMADSGFPFLTYGDVMIPRIQNEIPSEGLSLSWVQRPL